MQYDLTISFQTLIRLSSRFCQRKVVLDRNPALGVTVRRARLKVVHTFMNL